MQDKKTITEYFSYMMPYYQLFWYRNKDSLAIHWGFWDQNTKNLNEALKNTNKFLAEKARIKKGEVVLDAGCGVGGSSLWLAKNIEAKVTGISISKIQIKMAKKMAQYNSLKNIKFHVMDYTKTKFRSNSFDVIWAVESVCYSEPKEDFLKESYRLLKKGGRLIIADGFITRELTSRENKEVNNLVRGFGAQSIPRTSEFRNLLSKTGFKKVKFWDKTKNIMPSARKLYNMAVPSYPLTLLSEKLHITSPILTKHMLACLAQYHVYKDGLVKYGVFLCTK